MSRVATNYNTVIYVLTTGLPNKQNIGAPPATSIANELVLPFSSGSACSSTSAPDLNLDDPWLFFCFFFSDRCGTGL